MDKLQKIFVSEARQLVDDLERSLLDFEKDTHNLKTIQEIFRVMHTLKGSASMFGYESLSSITHDIETVYDGIRNGKLNVTEDIVAVTLDLVDHLKALISDQHLNDKRVLAQHNNLISRIRCFVPSVSSDNQLDATEGTGIATFYVFYQPDLNSFTNGTNPLFLIDDLTALGNCKVLPHFHEVPVFADLTEQCRVSFEIIIETRSALSAIREVFIFVESSSQIIIEKIADGELIKSGQLEGYLSSSLISTPPLGLSGIQSMVADLRHGRRSRETATNLIPTARTESTSIRVDSGKLDELMNLISELVTSQARLSLLSEQNTNPDLLVVSETIEKITRRLRDNAFNICLVPIDTLAVRFQRLVRDVAKELNKEILFTTEGLETEIDRSVIEKVTDPILHILRNCIDHGIELPDERIRKGKSREGTIHFKAYHAGTHVHIEISDNGRGMNPELIREKAISKGLISNEDLLSDEDLFKLIFVPGFSTVEKVTDLSGRGVGMDIVKRNIDSIHGEVFLRTSVEKGTTFSIRLPLTLSIMDGMLVELGGSKYLLPLTVIDKCYEIPSALITTEVQQKHVFDEHMLPVLNLHQIFHRDRPRPAISQVIKINFDFPVGVTVDSVIGEYQAVMKPLGGLYQKQDEFSGATILGDGSVALVLDTTTLIKQVLTNAN